MRTFALILVFIGAAGGCDRLYKVPHKRPRDAYDLRDDALKQARNEGKQVFLWFSSDDPDWCEPFDRFQKDEEVVRILGKYFVPVRIDFYETASAQPLYFETGNNRGLPAFTILDQHGALLADSGQEQATNFGFPTTEAELAAFGAALKTAQPLMTDEELQSLRAKLQSMAPVLAAAPDP